MIYQKIVNPSHPQLAVLVDPDRQSQEQILRLIERARPAKIDYFFVGSSLLLKDRFEHTIRTIKGHCDIPVIIFPGNNFQVSPLADALLFLSLISSRNAEYLIGQQVIAAPQIKRSGIETIPTGYMLIDGGRISSTSYMTQTVPIPNDKPDIAVATATAGALLGLKAIYLEAGSGAAHPVSSLIIKSVRQQVALPLIVGGGIRSAEQAETVCMAGADVVVVGNLLEQEPERLMDISLAVHGSRKVEDERNSY